MSYQKSPKYSTFRLAQGPSPDGKWRERRKREVHDMATEWRTEMKEKIEKKLAERASTQTEISQLFTDAVSAVKKVAIIASDILTTMRNYSEPFVNPLPPPFSYFKSLLEPLPVIPQFSLFQEEIFTAEEIAIEQKWIVPLVSFPEESA